MGMCDICGEALKEGDMRALTEADIVGATANGFIPSKMPLQGFAELFGVSLSKVEQWKGTVAKYKGTGAKWGVCAHCESEILPFLGSHSHGKWWQFWKRD